MKWSNLLSRLRSRGPDPDEGESVYISKGRRWFRGRILGVEGDGFLVDYNGIQEVVASDRVLTEEEKQAISKSQGNIRVRRR